MYVGKPPQWIQDLVDRYPIIAHIFLLLIGIGMIVFCCFFMAENLSVVINNQEHDAIVVKAVQQYRSNYYIYEYRIANQTIRDRQSIPFWDWSRYFSGRKIKILVNPDFPERTLVKNSIKPLLYSLFFLIFGASSLGLALWGIKKDYGNNHKPRGKKITIEELIEKERNPPKWWANPARKKKVKIDPKWPIFTLIITISAFQMTFALMTFLDYINFYSNAITQNGAVMNYLLIMLPIQIVSIAGIIAVQKKNIFSKNPGLLITSKCMVITNVIVPVILMVVLNGK